MVSLFVVQIVTKHTTEENSGYPDQTPHSGLVLHCLPMSHKKAAWLLWINTGSFKYS